MSIIFKPCPKCNGYGVRDNGSNCRTCGGWGAADGVGSIGSGEVMYDSETGQQITAAMLAKRTEESRTR